MVTEFTAAEWKKINQTLTANSQQYGFPQRTYGSALLASFNIRKLGKKSQRSANTWQFLAHICKQFDLLFIQEIMDDLEGFDHLLELMGPDFRAVVSDRTGVFPGERGMGERLDLSVNHFVPAFAFAAILELLLINSWPSRPIYTLVIPLLIGNKSLMH